MLNSESVCRYVVEQRRVTVKMVSSEFGVTTMTARRALTELVTEGKLTVGDVLPVGGRGRPSATFVPVPAPTTTTV